MAARGWYPDPGGTPDHYRYWDGTNWSAETTTDPATPPPASAAPDTRRRKGSPVLGLIIALVVVVAVVVVLGVRAMNTSASSLRDPDPPESTISGWDDSKPLPTATPTPTASEESSDAAPQGQIACADGQPGATAAHPDDGRKHGGALSFAPPDWREGGGYASTISWGYDVDGVMESTEPGWAALLAVGALKTEDGFTKPKQAAGAMMQCIASSGFYTQFESRKDLSSKKVTVDGHPGWSLRSEIRVGNESLSVPGDVAEVIIVDSGEPDTLSFFVGFVPIGDQDRIQILDRTIADLRVG